MTWGGVVLFALFATLPGPQRSPFSGIPFSSKAHVVAALIAIVALVMALFPPRRQARRAWLIALFVLILLKLALMPLVITEGWRGWYWKGESVQRGDIREERLKAVPFYHRGVQDSRVDRLIAFDGPNFALHYVNDLSHESVLKIDNSDVVRPLRVRWEGYVDAPAAWTFSTNVTANGQASIAIDGVEIFRGQSPRGISVVRPASGGLHRITITYDKPADTRPAISLTPPSLPVTPVAASAAAIARSRFAGTAIEVLGVLALLALAGMLFDAYHPLTRFFLEDVWLAPDRVALAGVVTLFLLVAVRAALLTRGATMPLGVWDDPYAYEGGARLVLFDSWLMTVHDGRAFVFYPFYSYVLAGAHALFGEDYSTIRLLNWSCVAATAVLGWTLLRKYLSPSSLVAALIGYVVFVWAHVATYAHAPFSDNLFLPLALATVVACANAFRKESVGWLLAVGILTALGAAARPSLLLFPPVFLVTLGLFWAGGKRLKAAGAFILGFLIAIAPFTLRNWIVSHKLVLLVTSGNIMLPLFLYPPGVGASQILERGATTSLGAIKVFLQLFAAHPLYSLEIEIRKVLFTFGISSAANYPFGKPLLLFFIPLFFFLAVLTRRVPRPVLIAIVSFAVSHLIAMVVATPWTYGYKTIVPFHLILAAGAVFLLPRRGDVPIREVVAARNVPTGRKSISVVLPTYNEKDSIRQVVLDFLATGIVDEVIVVNNNAAPGTSEEVAGTGAREVMERRQGYGRAIRRGLEEAKGDYIVLCEPDGTFLARDIFKLLAYADDFDVVYGSRTSQQFVWRGANMGFFLRWGNWAVAKYMEFLFNATSLTDVGCTMRLIRRDVAESLRDEFRIEGSQFGPEMMVLTLRHGYRVVQVPVNYLERVGVSSVTGDPGKAFHLGMQMIWLITRHRFARAVAPRPETANVPGAETA